MIQLDRMGVAWCGATLRGKHARSQCRGGAGRASWWTGFRVGYGGDGIRYHLAPGTYGVRNQRRPRSVSFPSPRRPQLLGAYLLSLCCLAELVYKLAHSHQHRQDQPSGQDDEDAPNLLDAQGAGLFVFLLGTPAAPPPLLLQDVQLVFLLQLQDGDGDLVPVWGA